ncbi:hotdog domain-containing protein [Rhodococcus sp. X156]|uniref:hotdog domain-containing protein n=1 Tax=Rhodococcus sp. X156 TaxID=2499145 RepID=UPI000FD8729B|nr:hotdog domain-containing protein [Rhodococcus sp. X156]
MTQADTGFGSASPNGQSPTGHPVAVVEATRRVGEALLRTDLPAEELQDIAAQLDAIAARLAVGAPSHEQVADELRGWKRPPEHDPASGARNVVAPPLRLVGDGPRTMIGEVTLNWLHHGPPHHAHGGVSALILDHALGVCNGWAGKPGVTASLTMTYHRMTPLNVPLTVRTECLSIEGRKIRTVGSIEHEGQVCVSAEGLFIALPGMQQPEQD